MWQVRQVRQVWQVWQVWQAWQVLQVWQAWRAAPVLPQLVVPDKRLGKVAEYGHGARELQNVEPHVVGQPREWLGPLRGDVEGTATRQQHLLGLFRQHAGDRLDAHRQHEGPDLLVPLEEAPLDVAGEVEAEELDDVDDALGGERGAVGVGDGVVEEGEELLQRDLPNKEGPAEGPLQPGLPIPDLAHPMGWAGLDWTGLDLI